MMDAPGASNDHDYAVAFQTRDRIPRSHNESKISVSKTRRATGESVSRPKPAHTRPAAASSASSAPRPIPKSNNKRAIQSGSESISYSFDDVIVDPFLPSTPPTFTPSMKPTGAFKPIPSEESTSSPKSTPNTTSHKKTAPSNPAQTVPKPFSGQAARSRNVSVSSLTRPNHDDMILPAVARRIKEQGLHEHNVIAYSDDYDAPLYKRPPSPGSVGNPFAGYDRAKAASSASLAQQQLSTESPASSSSRQLDSEQGKDTSIDMDEEYPVPPVPSIKKNQERERKDDGALLNATNAPALLNSTSNASSPGDTSSHAQNERLRPSKSRQQPYEQQQEQSYQHQQEDEQQQQQHEQQMYLQQQNSNSNSPSSSRPERPQRARRNTGRQTQQEFAPANDGYASQRTRRPTAPGNYEHMQGSAYDTQYQESDLSSQRQHQGRHNAQQGRNEDYSQQVQSNDSRGRRYAGNNQAYSAEEQWQGQSQQQQQSRYQPTCRHDDYDRTQADYNYQQTHHQEDYGRAQDGYNHQHTNTNYQNYGADHSRHHQSKPEMVQVEMSEMGSNGKEGETTETGESNNDPKDKMKKKGAVCCVVM